MRRIHHSLITNQPTIHCQTFTIIHSDDTLRIIFSPIAIHFSFYFLMNVMKEIERLNERELELGLSESASWHWDYRHSAYIFIGGIDTDLTEGDILTIFSQFGEIVDLHLVRDKTSGKSLGYGFLAYEDQRSTILAIDNMNGYKLFGRFLRVDHADKFRRPKGSKAVDGDGKLGEGPPEDDPDYDQRRKKIWDYDKYGTASTTKKSSTELGVGELPPFEEIGSMSTTGVGSSSLDRPEDVKHADRILQMLAEKQKARSVKQQESKEEEKRGKSIRRSRSRSPRRRSRSRSRNRDRR